MRRLIPLLVFALAVTTAGSALADGKVVSMDDRSTLDDAERLASQLPFHLLLLPDNVRAELGPSMDTTLPGPNAPLAVDASFLLHDVSIYGFDHQLGDLQAPSLFPAASASYPSYATEGPDGLAGADGSSSTSSTDDAASSQASGSPMAGPQAPSTQASAQSADAAASSSNPLQQAWDSLDAQEKTALTAGALAFTLFGAFSMYSRISRDEALENDTRREIFEIVEANPGICIKDVSDNADVSYSTASYHLDRLVKMDYLARRDEGNKVLYYKNGGTFTRAERELVPVLKNEEAMRVFTHILENPWCYRAEVAEALGVSHTTINWHLKRLTKADLVEEHREGRNCHLFIDEPAIDRVVAVMEKLEQVQPEAAQAPMAAAVPA